MCVKQLLFESLVDQISILGTDNYFLSHMYKDALMIRSKAIIKGTGSSLRGTLCHIFTFTVDTENPFHRFEGIH